MTWVPCLAVDTALGASEQWPFQQRARSSPNVEEFTGLPHPYCCRRPLAGRIRARDPTLPWQDSPRTSGQLVATAAMTPGPFLRRDCLCCTFCFRSLLALLCVYASRPQDPRPGHSPTRGRPGRYIPRVCPAHRPDRGRYGSGDLVGVGDGLHEDGPTAGLLDELHRGCAFVGLLLDVGGDGRLAPSLTNAAAIFRPMPWSLP